MDHNRNPKESASTVPETIRLLPEHSEACLILPSTSKCSTAIAWKDLQIFRGCNHRLDGHFDFATVNFISGSNGSGKSTLLRCLAGRTSAYCGNVYVNLQNRNKNLQKRIIFLDSKTLSAIEPNLTVLELLRFAFKFKNGYQRDSHAHIENVMNELSIDRIAQRYAAQCSPGELKQVALAQELMSLKKPLFLFIDQLLDGVDVVDVLKRMAATSGMTVVIASNCVDLEIVSCSDKVYVLEESGSCVYSGEPKAIGSFLKQELGLEVDPKENSLEKLLQISAKNSENTTQLSQKCSEINSTEVATKVTSLTRDVTFNRPYFSLYSLVTLLYRQLGTLKLCQLFGLTLGAVIMLLLLSSAFNSTMSSATGCQPLEQFSRNLTEKEYLKFIEEQEIPVQENIGFLVFMGLTMGLVVMVGVGSEMRTRLKVARIENENNWYSLTVFYISQTIISAICTLLFTLTTSLTAYLATNQSKIHQESLQNHTRLIHYLFLMSTFMLYTASLAQLVTILIPKPKTVSILTSTILFILLFLPNDNLVKIAKLPFPWLQDVAEILGSIHFTHYLLTLFYGFGRCDRNTEYSWILHKYRIQGSQSIVYTFRLCINIAFVQLISLLILVVRQSTIIRRHLHTSYRPLQSACWTSKGMFSGAKDESTTKLEIMKINADANLLTLDSNSEEDDVERFLDDKISIAWRHLKLASTQQQQTVGHEGQFKFGSLNLLLGPPGSGKSAFISALSGRLDLAPHSTIFTSKYVKIDAYVICGENLKLNVSCECTVKQYLLYTSKLKNVNISEAGRHEDLIENLLENLNLAEIANRKLANCSNGQRMMLQIAAELTAVVLPRVIFIDEVISRLDAIAMKVITSYLKRLAVQHNSTIILAIPGSSSPPELLKIIDDVVLLSLDGTCIYFGSAALLSNSAKNCGTISENTLLKDTQPIPSLIPIRTRFCFNSVHLLTQRVLKATSFWNSQLPPILLLFTLYAISLRILFNPQIALASGCYDFEQEATIMSAQQDDLTANVIYNLFVGPFGLMLVILQTALGFSKGVKSFQNEHQNGWYSSGSYYLSQTILELLLTFPAVFLYTFIINIYSTINPTIFWHFLFLFYLSVLSVQPLGHVIALLCGPKATSALSLTTIGVFLLGLNLSNIFTALHTLHYVAQYIATFAVSRYLFEGLLLLQYGFDRCEQREIQTMLYLKELVDADYWVKMLMLFWNLIFWRMVAVGILVWKNGYQKKRGGGRGSTECQETEATIDPGTISGLSSTSNSALYFKLIEFTNK